MTFAKALLHRVSYGRRAAESHDVTSRVAEDRARAGDTDYAHPTANVVLDAGTSTGKFKIMPTATSAVDCADRETTRRARN
jgi:hypothetical protein